MAPRPFYRSRLFWLGIPGLVFLLWAWWISTRLYLSAGFSGTNAIGASLTDGEIVAHWTSGGWPDRRNAYGDYYVLSAEDRHDWKVGLTTASNVNPTFHLAVISCYKIASAYAIGWLLALAWRQRRKSRIEHPPAS
jgi:hypothetical protein